MTIGRIRASVLVAAVTAVMAASSAHADLTTTEVKCLLSGAKASQQYLAAKLKALEKCRNAGLKDGSCSSPDTTKIDAKLDAALSKACSLTAGDFQRMGFPGPCTDANVADGFTFADYTACMKTTHDAFITAAMDLLYDSTLPPTLSSADLKCQAEVAKQGAALATCVLKDVSKCRDAIAKGKPVGVPPDYCAISDPKTVAGIQKCRDKLTGGIAKKCTTAQVASLKICTPDQADAGSAASCLISSETVLLDGPEIAVPPDLIDYEYATRGGLCGDNVVNNLNEECDGTDDSACPGQCGTASDPDGFFACLCKNKPRMVVDEHANADTDNGWTGISSDGSVVEGGGFLVDLYDCDPMTGLCIAGPNCSLAPHSPCSVPDSAANGTTADSICANLGQGTCRKERTANGPHCYQDINKKCSPNPLPDQNHNATTCNAPGDYCVTTYHGAPVGQASGGVAVCNVSTLSEDVVGTVNLLDGTSALKVRQRAVVHNPITQSKPCPVCGGFCGISRNRCDNTHPCAPGAGTCIEAAVCSDGPRKDQSCRTTSPFGGELPFFGTTSFDCPPDSDNIISNINGNGLDINANPRTTGTVTLSPGANCTGTGFTSKACLGGTSEGRLCTVASECPGGNCVGRCFCNGQLKPNACGAACVGGANDAEPCVTDADCDPPNGFCHAADCRLNPPDTDSNQEGVCTQSATNDRACSFTTVRSCTQDSDCQTSASCPFCQANETCVNLPRQCFVNSGIIRIGSPGVTDRDTAAIYCVPGNGGAIDATAGFPGPGALIQHEHILTTP